MLGRTHSDHLAQLVDDQTKLKSAVTKQQARAALDLASAQCLDQPSAEDLAVSLLVRDVNRIQAELAQAAAAAPMVSIGSVGGRSKGPCRHRKHRSGRSVSRERSPSPSPSPSVGSGVALFGGVSEAAMDLGDTPLFSFQSATAATAAAEAAADIEDQQLLSGETNRCQSVRNKPGGITGPDKRVRVRKRPVKVLQAGSG